MQKVAVWRIFLAVFWPLAMLGFHILASEDFVKVVAHGKYYSSDGVVVVYVCVRKWVWCTCSTHLLNVYIVCILHIIVRQRDRGIYCV